MRLPKGYLVAIGGAEDKGDEKTVEQANGVHFLENGILKIVVNLMGVEQPTIAIITSATAYPRDAYRNYRDAFSQLGCSNICHIDIRETATAHEEEMLRRIEKCQGVMFTGGDQSKLYEVLQNTPVLQRIKDRYLIDPYFVVAGTSAGAAAMSDIMMNGGNTEKAYFKGEISLSDGFGFLKEAIIDTHFDARGRFARLSQAVAAKPGIVGIGLSEDTGAIIEKGTTLKVIGSGSVTIIDGSEVEYNNINCVRKGAPISIGKLGIYLMANSDRFNLKTKKFTPVAFEEFKI